MLPAPTSVPSEVRGWPRPGWNLDRSKTNSNLDTEKLALQLQPRFC